MLDLEKLKSLGSIRTFKEDETIFYEGECGSEMYMVLRGQVGIFVNSFDGNPINLTVLNSGDFFGEMSVLDGQKRSASAISMCDSILLGLNKDNFEAFISAQPSVALKIMKGLCLRIRNLNAELSKATEGSRKPADHTGTIETSREEKKVTASDVLPAKPKSSLFPKGHKPYISIAPETYNDFLYDKEITCPVCEKSINVKMQRISKLKLLTVEPDFRQKYVDFEPLWYTIWLCPSCNYANFYYEFESLPARSVKALIASGDEIRNKLPEKFSGAHEINKVFTAYYMALFCAEAYNAPPLKLAKLWMQISWLYKDQEDYDMYNMAASKALEYYHSAYYNSKLSVSVEQEQQLNIIMGELYLLKGERNEALKCFHAAIKRSQGKPLLNQQAQLRVEELRSSHK